jgi:hypothetical protein
MRLNFLAFALMNQANSEDFQCASSHHPNVVDEQSAAPE